MRFSVNLASKSVSKMTRFGICGNNRGRSLLWIQLAAANSLLCPCGDPAFSARPPGIMGVSA
ncbi:hypothetical protein B5K05_31345 [Rhizobium phaseoli]|uniref:Uncharacterized protein n=1 Tax=Rhizobium etli (strain CIAT 652) TaxID=491916 RepID=B3Q218_RHIE6|nr:hypothetical protein RHECIAT_PA0000380 [Rhizobium etli CIAT 652]KKZ84912.1 hypothetical protein RPHASCH2410_PB00860 [Rhizobium phaseoli Ch24-10]PCD67522.1 hypothetical protein CO648_11255 [Rhizobium phaseoli]PDS72779.1 hypothetical protein CO651_09065 [Rhizobium phaseoli]PWI50397.1 hypothetical protein B5K03_30955 [Rhizobium phaseoli]